MRLLSPSAWEVHTVNMKQPGDGGKKEKTSNILCFLYSYVNIGVSEYSIFSTDLQNDERGRGGGDVRLTTAAVY